ncbi:methionine ABC transporter ATP-binding protein [Enterococcus larvae]|uniref:methionine ABC transporter ATP-binding protein n=1 Tax=Enterococcus larvae TaxID=2794352 RepID=UPI003F352FFC
MIVFDKVSKYYDYNGTRKYALKELSVSIPSKEIFGVIGESGSGKSTLLKLLSTLEKPDAGKIQISGRDILSGSKEELQRKRRTVGMIFQHFNLLYNRTALENVALPLKLAGVKSQEKAKEVLRFVRLEEKTDHYPKQLSGGEKQRVAIARALVNDPTLLLCDEPTSALDGQNAYEVMELLRQINQELGTTIILVSHELELIKQLCTQAAILENGSLLETVSLSPLPKEENFPSYYERIKERLK